MLDTSFDRFAIVRKVLRIGQLGSLDRTRTSLHFQFIIPPDGSESKQEISPAKLRPCLVMHKPTGEKVATEPVGSNNTS